VNKTSPSTISTGAPAAAVRLRECACLIIPPPAATRTNMNVPSSSDKLPPPLLRRIGKVPHRSLDRLGLVSKAPPKPPEMQGIHLPRRAVHGHLLPTRSRDPPVLHRLAKPPGGRHARAGSIRDSLCRPHGALSRTSTTTAPRRRSGLYVERSRSFPRDGCHARQYRPHRYGLPTRLGNLEQRPIWRASCGGLDGQSHRTLTEPVCVSCCGRR
jgi:hypothetical protein